MTAMTRSHRFTLTIGLCAALCACSAPTFKSDFSASVTFTPAALSALKAANETAFLEAYYYGAPTETTKEKANESGQIELGEDQVTFDPATPSVHVAGNGLDLEHLKSVEGGKVSVDLSVHSGTDRADVIKCQATTAALTDLQTKPVTLTCDAA